MSDNEFVLPDDKRVPFQGVPPLPGDAVLIGGRVHMVEARSVFVWEGSPDTSWRVWVTPGWLRGVPHPGVPMTGQD